MNNDQASFYAMGNDANDAIKKSNWRTAQGMANCLNEPYESSDGKMFYPQSKSADNRKFSDVKLGEKFMYGRVLYIKCRHDKAFTKPINCGPQFFDFWADCVVEVIEL